MSIWQNGPKLIHKGINFWQGKTNAGVDANQLYIAINTTGTVNNEIAYVSKGGNDTTAQYGNPLKPYATILAATTRLGVLPDSTLYISAGLYILDDTNAPEGLLTAIGQYNIYMEPGTYITYTGTYGAFISGNNPCNVYGQGNINGGGGSYSGTVDGVNNYLVNIGNNGRADRYIQFQSIQSNDSFAFACQIGSNANFSSGNKLVFICPNILSVRGSQALSLYDNCQAEIYVQRLWNKGNRDGTLLSIQDNGQINDINININEFYYGAAGGPPAVIDITQTGGGSIYMNNSVIRNFNGAGSMINIVNMNSIGTPDITMNNIMILDRGAAGTYGVGQSAGAVTLKLPNVLSNLPLDPLVTNATIVGVSYASDAGL